MPFIRPALRTLLCFCLMSILPFSMACGCGDDDNEEGNWVGDNDTQSDDISDDSATDDISDDADDMTDDAADDSAADDSGDDADDDIEHGIGWVVGYIDNGDGADYDAIMWRDDHGVWTEETLPDLGASPALYGVKALGVNDVWAVGRKGDRSDPDGLILHRTASGWSEVDMSAISPDAAAMGYVDFLNTHYGWFFGSSDNDYILMRYRDGVWDEINSAVIYEAMMPNSIALVAEDEGWIVGNAAWFWISLGYHLVSGTWTKVPALSTVLMGSNIDIAMENPDHGYVTTCTADIPIVVSTVREYIDGTWRLLDDPILPNGCFHQTAFEPNGTAHIIGRQDLPNVIAYMVTKVSGIWQKDSVADLGGAKPTFYEMDFAEDNVGYGVGIQQSGHQTRGLVLRYESGAWTVVDPPSSVENAIYYGVSYL